MQIHFFTQSCPVGLFAAYLPLDLIECFFVWEDIAMRLEKRDININGVKVTAYSDGSIEKPHHRRTKRQFGTKTSKGYMHIDIGGTAFQAHRIIAAAFFPGYSDQLNVDHINGDKSDNRPENLRMMTHSENLRAFRKKSGRRSSKYRGICWDNVLKKWRARITINGTQKHIGCFDKEQEAAIAWNNSALKNGYSKEALNLI